jgi:hypothetical protein
MLRVTARRKISEMIRTTHGTGSRQIAGTQE